MRLVLFLNPSTMNGVSLKRIRKVEFVEDTSLNSLTLFVLSLFFIFVLLFFSRVSIILFHSQEET